MSLSWGLRYLLCLFFSTLTQRGQALAPVHTPAFLGCLSWYFSSHFVYPQPLSPDVTNTFPPPTTTHHATSTPAPRRAGSNRWPICIYITWVMCSVLLRWGWTAWYQHDTLEIACHLKPSSQGSFHMQHQWSTFLPSLRKISVSAHKCSREVLIHVPVCLVLCISKSSGCFFKCIKLRLQLHFVVVVVVFPI